MNHLTNQSTTEKPEWLSVKNAVARFEISRSSLYELIQNGAIKSSCLCKRGNIRGKRLISFDSLNSYVEKFATNEVVSQGLKDD